MSENPVTESDISDKEAELADAETDLEEAEKTYEEAETARSKAADEAQQKEDARNDAKDTVKEAEAAKAENDAELDTVELEQMDLAAETQQEIAARLRQLIENGWKQRPIGSQIRLAPADLCRAACAEYAELIRERGETADRVICDYISGMTDQYSISRFKEIFVPKSWSKY